MIHVSLGNSKDLTAANLAAQNATAVDPWAEPGAGLSDKSPAYRFGYQDAATRQPFVPEAYFAGYQRQSSYALGFLTAQPGNHAALAWWQDYIDAAVEDQRIEYDHADFVRGLGN